MAHSCLLLSVLRRLLARLSSPCDRCSGFSHFVHLYVRRLVVLHHCQRHLGVPLLRLPVWPRAAPLLADALRAGHTDPDLCPLPTSSALLQIFVGVYRIFGLNLFSCLSLTNPRSASLQQADSPTQMLIVRSTAFVPYFLVAVLFTRARLLGSCMWLIPRLPH